MEPIREVLAKLDTIAPVTMVEVAPVELADFDQLCTEMGVGGQRLPRMDSPGISAQPTCRNGRSWTACPCLRSRWSLAAR